MKKTIVAPLLILSLCLIFVGCTNRDKTNTTTANEGTESTDIQSQEISSTVDSGNTQQTENTTESTTLPAEPVGGSEDDYFGLRKYKYRYNYYRFTSPYIDIVGDEAYGEWIRSDPKYENFDIDEMLMVSYIKHFNITREQFDEASKNREKLFEKNNWTMLVYPFENDGEYSYDDEAYEIYNADIIYTFDNDIINEYYARPPELIIENGTNALGENVE